MEKNFALWMNGQVFYNLKLFSNAGKVLFDFTTHLKKIMCTFLFIGGIYHTIALAIIKYYPPNLILNPKERIN